MSDRARASVEDLRSSPSPWTALPDSFTTASFDTEPASEVNDLIGSMLNVGRGQSFLAWRQYEMAAKLHSLLVTPDPHDVFLNDQFARCATRVAYASAISQQAAEKVVREAVALRDRLPRVAICLREGWITPQIASALISRTDLIDGRSCAAHVDAEIADILARDRGGWSLNGARNLADRIIFRHDPDAIREQRQRALDARGVRVSPTRDGMGRVTISMAAENAALSEGFIKALAARVCEFDSRTTQQRQSDASFALLTRTPFTCDCGSETCTAATSDDPSGTGVSSKVIIHVVADRATLDGTADNAGFIAGHGVITDTHVRDLAARPDAQISPIVPRGTATRPDGTVVLPAHSASDPYRPSTALDTYVRVRDGYSVIPGNATSAWNADVDHVREFDHDNPTAGGLTVPDNLNVKDRRNHLIKTNHDWLDDQWRDGNGILRQEFITPEGLVIPGEPENLEALFPGLRRIRFEAPAQAPPATPPATTPEPDVEPTRSMTRVAAKHARRQEERERNRQRRATLDRRPPDPGWW